MTHETINTAEAIDNLVALTRQSQQVNIACEQFGILTHGNPTLNQFMGLEGLDDIEKFLASLYKGVVKAIKEIGDLIARGVKYLLKLIGINITDNRRYDAKVTPATDKKTAADVAQKAKKKAGVDLDAVYETMINDMVKHITGSGLPRDVTPFHKHTDYKLDLKADERIKLKNYLVFEAVQRAGYLPLSWLKRGPLHLNEGYHYLNDERMDIVSDKIQATESVLSSVGDLSEAFLTLYDDTNTLMREAISTSATNDSQVVLNTYPIIEAWLKSIEGLMQLPKIDRGLFKSPKSGTYRIPNTDLILVWQGSGLPSLTIESGQEESVELLTHLTEDKWEEVNRVSKAISAWDKHAKKVEALFAGMCTMNEKEMLTLSNVLSDNVRKTIINKHVAILNGEVNTRRALFTHLRRLVVNSIKLNNVYHNLYIADKWDIDLGI